MSDVKIKVIDSDKLINAINDGSYYVNLSAVMALGAVQQTLYGYKIEHLAYIAKVMEKEGITAEYAARTFDDMSRAIRMILDETQQKVEEVTKRGYKVVNVSTDSIKVANTVDEPKSVCSDCQEFDCYGCEHKEE